MDGSTFDTYRSTRFFVGLNGVRALSILAVLWHHTDNVWFGWPALARGFLGVDVFFVLSGFLIVTLLLREREATQRVDLSRFYLRRTFRIFPLYYAGILIYFVATRVFSGTSAFEAEPFDDALPFLALYVANWHLGAPHCFAHAWSLAAEEQFYLVWPPLERWFAGRLAPILVAALLVNQAINFGLVTWLWPSFERFQAGLEILQVTFTPMLLGIALAYALHHRESYQRVAKWVAGRRTAIVLIMVGIIVAPIEDIQGAPRLVFHVAATLALANLIIDPDARLVQWLEWAPLRRLGEVSYGVYVLHMLVVLIAAGVLARLGVRDIPGLLMVVSTLGTWGLAEISFRTFESPFLRLKDRFGHAKAV
ncbi:MAG: acyltransferase [Myxococcota bacterium]